MLEEPASAFAERRYSHALDRPERAASELLTEGAVPSIQEPTAIAHSVFRLCARLSEEEPIVLLVDDAQWSDPPSLEVMSYLARRIDDVAVLLLVGARASAPGAIRDLLGLIGVARATSVLRPRPLSPTGAVQLIHAIAPTATVSVCGDHHRDTAGNPWLLTELARQIARSGGTPRHDPRASKWSISGRGRETIRQRLAELEPAERAVALALAILDPHEPTARVAALTSGIASTDLAAARQALSAAGLLAPVGTRLAHGLIAAAIRDGLEPAESERLHRAAASLASGRGAPGAAVRYLERAEGERAPGDEHGLILAELATAAFDAGLPGSRERLRESLREASLPTCRIDVLTRLAGLSVVDNGDTELAELIERELATQPDPNVRVAVEVAALDTLVAAPTRPGGRGVGAGRAVRGADLAAAPEGSASLERVRIQLEFGATLAAIGRRTEARQHLRPALAAADAIGALPLAERARRELVATGLRPRRAAVAGEASLTPRQREILALAAQGKPNKTIAQELFLSVKTVETHLAAGYRKLGVRGRHEVVLP